MTFVPKWRTMRTGIAVFLALLLAPYYAIARQPAHAAQVPAPFTPATARAIDAAARAEVHSGSTPGLAVGIVEDGLLVYAHGFGYASLRPKRLAGARTQFYTGSITQQFTAACVLLLAQHKKLSLDDKVTRYIPELTIAKNVTVRDLLTQTSGLPRMRDARGIAHDLTRPVKMRALIEAVNSLPMTAAPGTTFNESNFNYLLAGLIVQRVSGLPLSVFYSTHIFQPLIMTSSFLAGDQGISARHAVGYTRLYHRFVRAPQWNASWLFGSADLVTTVEDLAKWDIGLPLLLNVDSVREMWTGSGMPGQLQYGMGWVIDQRGGQRFMWQSGQLDGYRAMNAVLPDEHIAVIVFANAGSLHGDRAIQPERLANHILDIIAPLPRAHFENTITTRAVEWLRRLARNDIDRTQLTTAFSRYLTDRLVHRSDFAAYGPVLAVVPAQSYQRAADTVYVFDVKFRRGVYRFDFTLAPDGKVDGLFLEPYR